MSAVPSPLPAAGPETLTIVPVPFSASGIAVGQLAKRLGVPIDAIWIPIRPNARTVDVAEDVGVAIIHKSAFTNALAASPAPPAFEPITVRNEATVNVATTSAAATTEQHSSSSTRQVPAMISNRPRMIRAMGGIGDGRRMQINFRFVPPHFVCFVQSIPNSRVVISKAAKEAMGGEDTAYAAVLVRNAVSPAELLAEGSTVRPLGAEDEGATMTLTLGAEKRPREAADVSGGPAAKKALAEGESSTAAPATTTSRAEKKKPSALTKLLMTPEGAFLSDVEGTATHSALWLRVKASVAANGLHKPPLHRSRLFFPAGTSAIGATSSSSSHRILSQSQQQSAQAAAVAAQHKRVTINGTSWQLVEPHCLLTSFNYRGGGSGGGGTDLVNLSTSKIAAIAVEAAFLSAHRYFRATAHASAALMSAPSAASSTSAEGESGGEASAMALATAFEGAVRHHNIGLCKDIGLVVGGTRGGARGGIASGPSASAAAAPTPFSPTTMPTVGLSSAGAAALSAFDSAASSSLSSSSHFEATVAAFQRRCRELSLQGYRIVLFAAAPELHHADEKSIEAKLSSLAACVGALVSPNANNNSGGSAGAGDGSSATAAAPMPPVTLLVSVASAVTSSAAWGGGLVPASGAGTSAAVAAGGEAHLQAAVNAKMLWRAFVRHTNQNKFPSADESFVVVARRGGANAADSGAVADGGDGAESAVLSDVPSFVTAAAVGGGVAKGGAASSAADPSKAPNAIKTTAFLAALDDGVFSRQCVAEDGKGLRVVSASAFLEGRAVAV